MPCLNFDYTISYEDNWSNKVLSKEIHDILSHFYARNSFIGLTLAPYLRKKKLGEIFQNDYFASVFIFREIFVGETKMNCLFITIQNKFFKRNSTRDRYIETNILAVVE